MHKDSPDDKNDLRSVLIRAIKRNIDAITSRELWQSDAKSVNQVMMRARAVSAQVVQLEKAAEVWMETNSDCQDKAEASAKVVDAV